MTASKPVLFDDQTLILKLPSGSKMLRVIVNSTLGSVIINISPPNIFPTMP